MHGGAGDDLGGSVDEVLVQEVGRWWDGRK
jgi:hypothetical protein